MVVVVFRADSLLFGYLFWCLIMSDLWVFAYTLQFVYVHCLEFIVRRSLKIRRSNY